MSAALLTLLAPSIRDEWSKLPASGQIGMLQRHRLLPVALAEVRQTASLGALHQGLWDTLNGAERGRVERDGKLLVRALTALKQRGCAALLLKGVALGRWLYPAPELRTCSDIDLLVDQTRRLDAHAALVDAGLQSDGYSHFDRASNQSTYHDPATDRHVDLHWALSVVPELACRVSFAELHADSIELNAPAGARALGRIHALMHAVIHYHAHQPVTDRPAIWLYDMVLLVRGLDGSGWNALDRAVRRAELAGLHAAALIEAQRWFPLDLPTELIQQWQQLGKRECTCELLKPERGPLRKLLRSLRCLPSMRQRLEYLAARVFPSSEWMRGRYAARTRLQLTRAYLRRWTSGMRQTLSGKHDA